MLIQLKKVLLTIAVFILAASISFAADNKEISIKTNMHCGSCKTKIETGLNKTNGIIESSADVDSKIVKVKYDAAKTNPQNITKAITDMGYKVDEACKMGPECCKLNGGVCKEKNKMGKSCDDKSSKSSKGCDVKATKTKVSK
jgi:Cu+-exporting ATPase